jgi:hypothetical protein
VINVIFLKKDELETWLEFLDRTRETAAEETCNGNEPVLVTTQKECKILNKVINQLHAGHTYGIKMP